MDDTSPQVVLMDPSMPVLDGVAATRRITAEHPGVEVLVVTSLSDQQRVTEASPPTRSAVSSRTPIPATSSTPSGQRREVTAR